MKVLPMMQPWASLVVGGVKLTETRDRHTSERGPVLVLATKTSVSYLEAPGAWNALAELLELPTTFLAADVGRRGEQPLHRGKIIGVVRVCDSVRTMDLGWDGSDDVHGWVQHDGFVRVHPDQRPLGDFGLGRRAWLLADPVRFEQPIICRGMPGMFNAPPDVEREAVFQWKRERNDMTEAELLRAWSS